jgi:hypothetical protein
MRPFAFVVLPLFAALAACDEPVPENNSCDGDWFVPFLANETESTSDLSCAEALSDAAPFDAACQTTAALEGQIVDHQSGDPLPDIGVTVHHGDDLGAAADWTATSDADGAVAHDVPLCTPIAYVTDRGNDDARVTFGQHVILTPGDDGAAPAFDFRSVANGSISLITLILGVDLKDENGFAFGKAVGCDGDVAVEKLQVLVRDENCTVPPLFSPGYTTNELPDAFARATTADGFFFVSNVPPGTWTLEGYVTDGDSFRLVASAPMTVRAKEVTLVDLQIGRSDGVRLKANCTSGC